MYNCNCNYNYHNTNADVLGAALIAYGIYTTYQKWKMRRRIKKYLKIVVEFSNIIQDMKKANFKQQDINEQYNYVLRLILKQRNAMRDLVIVERQQIFLF